ncbi:MAG: hypothetical protein JWQ98_3501 [Chlorobi bacterium]|nr:hypothetical protein [Chlorobiota bacterium]
MEIIRSPASRQADGHSEKTVSDILYLLIMAAFLAASIGYTFACERL